MSSEKSIYFSIANDSDWNSLKDAQLVAEMILGRRPTYVTPSLIYNVHGIDAEKKYSASVTIKRVDDFFYKYHKQINKFVPHQQIHEKTAPSVLAHKDGSQLGSHWLENGIDFTWLTVTHRKEQVSSSTALVESRCMYQPIVRIWETECEETFWESSTEAQKFVIVTGHFQPGFVAIKRSFYVAKEQRRVAVKRKAEVEVALEEKRAKLEENQKREETRKKSDEPEKVEPKDKENLPLPDENVFSKSTEEQPGDNLRGFSYYLMVGALRLLQFGLLQQS